MHIQSAALRPIANTLWSQPADTLPHLTLFGLDLVNAGVVPALDELSRRVRTRTATRVAFVNAHCINIASGDLTYRDALDTADLLLPDGSGIALAARLRGARLAANLNGTDLIPALCERLARSGHSVFLLGGRPGVAEAAAGALRARALGLRIAGTRDGFFSADEEDSVIAEINESGASVLLVAMGVPLQDAWLARVSARLRPMVSFGVGGLFDFMAGRVSRAPAALRRAGLEWTWRLYQEPSRMWRRYILGNPAFVLRAVVDASPALRNGMTTLDDAAKRALDITATAAGLALIAPLLLTVAALVRLTSKGPAILRQTRIGKDGVPFTMYKFRSMYIDADARRAALIAANAHGADGVTFKMARDPRVTKLGRLIRKSSIDELPQLWNILKGDMSLVGPRPPLPSEVARYQPHHHRRLAAKPGLTCLWQISGRANIAFEQQCELDVRYMRTRNIWVDLSILLRTVPAVLAARGAY